MRSGSIRFGQWPSSPSAPPCRCRGPPVSASEPKTSARMRALEVRSPVSSQRVAKRPPRPSARPCATNSTADADLEQVEGADGHAAAPEDGGGDAIRRGAYVASLPCDGTAAYGGSQVGFLLVPARRLPPVRPRARRAGAGTAARVRQRLRRRRCRTGSGLRHRRCCAASMAPNSTGRSTRPRSPAGLPKRGREMNGGSRVARLCAQGVRDAARRAAGGAGRRRGRRAEAPRHGSRAPSPCVAAHARRFRAGVRRQRGVSGQTRLPDGAGAAPAGGRHAPVRGRPRTDRRGEARSAAAFGGSLSMDVFHRPAREVPLQRGPGRPITDEERRRLRALEAGERLVVVPEGTGLRVTGAIPRRRRMPRLPQAQTRRRHARRVRLPPVAGAARRAVTLAQCAAGAVGLSWKITFVAIWISFRDHAGISPVAAAHAEVQPLHHGGAGEDGLRAPVSR